MAKMILACRGEGHWGSRADDNAKIDLMLSMAHPWQAGERQLILCQVKSGNTFGAILENEPGFTLYGAAKTAARRTSHAICVIWVDRDKNRVFWAFLHPDTRRGKQAYGSHHELTPAVRFDLARCVACREKRGAEGGRGIILPSVSGNLAKQRAVALTSYRNYRAIKSPILGEVECTRLGWRHMFRKGRAAANKSASLNIIPRLPSLLTERPSAVAITSIAISEREKFEIRTCEYLLKYKLLRVLDSHAKGSRPATGYVRLIEEVLYPKDWESRAMTSEFVLRRVVLKSAYYKMR